MRDNVPMTTRTSTKTNGKTHRKGERSPRQARDGDAKAARVDAPEKVDDVVGSRPIARIGNLSSDFETTPTTTAAAATESDDEEEGVADEEVVRLAVDGINIGAVAGTGGGTGAPKRDIKLRKIVQSLARVDAAHGNDRRLLRNFLYDIAQSTKTLLMRLDRVFGSEIKVDLRVTSPFQTVSDTIYTNRAPNESDDEQRTERVHEDIRDLKKRMEEVELERAAEKRREDERRGEIEREWQDVKRKLERVLPPNDDIASICNAPVNNDEIANICNALVNEEDFAGVFAGVLDHLVVGTTSTR